MGRAYFTCRHYYTHHTVFDGHHGHDCSSARDDGAFASAADCAVLRCSDLPVDSGNTPLSPRGSFRIIDLSENTSLG